MYFTSVEVTNSSPTYVKDWWQGGGGEGAEQLRACRKNENGNSVKAKMYIIPNL